MLFDLDARIIAFELQCRKTQKERGIQRKAERERESRRNSEKLLVKKCRVDSYIESIWFCRRNVIHPMLFGPITMSIDLCTFCRATNVSEWFEMCGNGLGEVESLHAQKQTA